MYYLINDFDLFGKINRRLIILPIVMYKSTLVLKEFFSLGQRQKKAI